MRPLYNRISERLSVNYGCYWGFSKTFGKTSGKGTAELQRFPRPLEKIAFSPLFTPR
jgi:hypothetical protein